MSKSRILYAFIALAIAFSALATTPLTRIVPDSAQAAVDRFAGLNYLRNANLSICLRSIDSDSILAAHCPDLAVGTASTMKTVTSATALLTLGKDFRFHTRIYAVGHRRDSKFTGKIVVEGAGDPTLGSRYFPNMPDITQQLADTLTALGIKKIHGSITADTSIYPDAPVSSWWNVDDLLWNYGAGAHALSFSDNVVRVSFNRSGAQPYNLTFTPEVPGLDANLSVDITENDNVWGTVTYLNRPTIHLYGSTTQSDRNWSALVANPLPHALLTDSICRTLKLHNIKLKHRNFAPKHVADTLLLVDYASPRLEDIIISLLDRSDNMFTEALLKAVGYHVAGIGSTQAGVSVVRRVWGDKGIDTTPLFMYDGSGLARTDKAATQFLTEMLRQIDIDAPAIGTRLSTLMTCLGKTGRIGNLLPNTPLNGMIASKSGSMTDVQCYVGYFPVDKPKYTWAVLVNNFGGTRNQLKADIDRMLIDIFLPTLSDDSQKK